MKFQKNDLVTIRIEDIGSAGEGIGKAEGFTVFVRDALLGDLAEVKLTKVKKSFGYGRLMRVIQASPYRVSPPCPVFGPCGGCQLQNMDYRAQLSWKENVVRNDLERIGGIVLAAADHNEARPDAGNEIESRPDTEEEVRTRRNTGSEIPGKAELPATVAQMEPISGMEHPFRYRNKALFPVRRDREGKLVAGYYAQHSHRVIPLLSLSGDGKEQKTRTGGDCLIGAKCNRPVLEAVLHWMADHRIEPYDEESGRGLVRHVLVRFGCSSGQILVCPVINGRKLPCADDLVRRLVSIDGMTSISYSVNLERTNVIMGSSSVTLWGSGSIEDSIGPLRFRISPLSFFQVNPVQTVRLYEKVLDFASLSGNETVWDLYCGIGSISLFLARKAKQVIGVEIIPQAVEDAKENALLNGISNAEFLAGKAEEVVPRIFREQKIRADVVVVDPPRKGCDEILLDTIMRMEPEKIVYVSCNPATLARDVKKLSGSNYQVTKVAPYDLFPASVHVETVVLMSRRRD
ncbi:MAG: 23S rRNA (uracil(1939)-C(5))-methyltransferase RlmD [Bilifractor sp.]|jgi:23S rRNA (uracil1939-C5)-methyltransferase